MTAILPRTLSPALLALALLPGCDGCGRAKPYTPFGVASTPASAATEPDAAPAGEADSGPPPKFVVRDSIAAPSRATRWSFDGRQITAPPGRIFERGLAADFDGDGSREIVAWTLPEGASNPTSPGQLWLFPAAGTAKSLLELPGFVPTGPACTRSTSLQQTGPKSVTLDVTATCTTVLLSRAPTRSLSVIAPMSDRPVVVTLRVAAAAPGEPFSLDLDSTDRDGDGRDDVRLVVNQKPICRGGSGTLPGACVTDKEDRTASAQVIWFDRPAGLSRDAMEPAQSLGALAAAELGRSKRKQSTAQVHRGVAQLRRLMGTLCAEGATARILDAEGSMLRCAPIAAVVDRLLVAEVQAALTDKDPLRALAALERDGWYFARAADKRRSELEKSILAGVGRVEPKATNHALDLPPRGATPRMSPLAFEADRSLLVQTRSGLVRVTDAGTTETLDADSGVASWPLDFATRSGRRVQGVVFSCDRSDAQLQLTGGSDAPEAPSGLLSPRPGACAGGKLPAAALIPLGEKDDRPAILVAGEPLGPRITRAEAVLRPRVLGSPRSPDGRHAVVPTSRGLWLDGGDQHELWRVDDVAALTDCTVADGGKAVACVTRTGVRVFRH